MAKLKTKGIQEDVTLKNLPALRQTFVVGSLVIILGYFLGATVNAWFMVLPLLPAAGLMVSGLAGFCPMEWILQRMPWNKEKMETPVVEDSVLTSPEGQTSTEV